MRNKQILGAIAMALLTPAIVMPIQTEAAVNNPFKDVSPNNAYYEIIHAMRDKGIITGYQDGTFKPQETISRKQAAALLNRATSLPKTVSSKDFKDVSTKNAYYNDIKAVQQAGIFKADSKGNFYPNKAVTRAEMAKALVIAFNLKGTTNEKFSDVSSSNEYYKYINTLYANEITTGDNGKFLPNQTLTRAHYSVFMYRAMGYKDVPTQPNGNITSADLLNYAKDTSVYAKNADVNPRILNNAYKKPLVNLATVDNNIIKQTGLKIVEVDTVLGLEEDNYVGNPKPGYDTVNQVNVTARQDGSFKIQFDFRSEKMVNAIPLLVKYLTDGYDLTSDIQKAILNAQEVAKDKYAKLDDVKFLSNDSYTVKIQGAEPAMAVGVIEIKPK